MARGSFDPRELLRAFSDGGVDFVVIGGVGAALQGASAVTYDLDLVLDPAPDNLDRAHEVLEGLEATFREHLPKVLLPARRDLESQGALLLMTNLGALDLLGTVAGNWKFEDLRARSIRIALRDDLVLQVLDLSALIEVKEKIGREKDIAVLPIYRRALEERDKHSTGNGDAE